MKKKLLLFGGLLAIGLSFFASCSDKEDESLAPSSVDAKPWTLDENMNTQIKPGDNFALYCWGKIVTRLYLGIHVFISDFWRKLCWTVVF